MKNRLIIAILFTCILVLLLRWPSPQMLPDSPDRPSVIAARDTVFLEEMTWMEVRDQLQAGTRTVIIPVGGIEQNGPYVALGKHNYIVRSMSDLIARKLGHTLVAPIVPHSPEGSIAPKTGHMQFPGTMSIQATTLQALLSDTIASLGAHGFTEVLLLADSGDAQEPLRLLAEQAPRVGPVTVRFIPEYYDYGNLREIVRSKGIHEVPEGIHDELVFSSLLSLVSPDLLRISERQAAGRTTLNGIELLPIERLQALGRELAEKRVTDTMGAIQRAREENPS